MKQKKKERAAGVLTAGPGGAQAAPSSGAAAGATQLSGGATSIQTHLGATPEAGSGGPLDQQHQHLHQGPPPPPPAGAPTAGHHQMLTQNSASRGPNDNQTVTNADLHLQQQTTTQLPHLSNGTPPVSQPSNGGNQSQQQRSTNQAQSQQLSGATSNSLNYIGCHESIR